MPSRFLLATLALSLLNAEDFKALDPSVHPTPQAMLSSYLQRIAQQQLATRRRQVETIATRDAYEARKRRIRAAALRMIGGLPDPRTPLNPRTTGTLTRDTYRVDKVVYESSPRFFVTANLYVPKGPGPFPAVLQPVGHSVTAKNRAFYQKIAIALVRQGFVVLTYDPIGQGERRIYWDNDLGDSKVGGTTTEHSMVGWQSLLGGETVARYKIWDGIRSIDYLQSLPIVDKENIGVAGCSGGGTLTTYIAALDDRVKAAAPACYITSWEDQLQGTGPQDAEQQFPDQLLEGLDHADWIGLAAPKPYLILSTDQDFFPLEGARKTFAEMKRIYTLYDAAIKVAWFHEPGPHGVPDASRLALVNFMRRWLKGQGDPVAEPPFQTEHEEDLNATPTGMVATSLGGETASTVNVARLRALAPKRPLTPTAVRDAVLRLTRYQPSNAPLQLRRARRTPQGVELLTFDSAEGLTIPAALATPAGQSRGTVLLLDPRGKAAAFGPQGDATALATAGYTVLAPDLSGIGEVAFARTPSAPWAYPQLASLALMTGKPLLGIRINDLIRAIDALKDLGALPPSGVTVIAKGKLSPVALHAAVLDPRIARVILEDALVSYAAIGASAIHRDIEDAVLPGVLASYDLPDLAAALAPRPVTLTNARSPVGRLLLRREAAAAYPSANVNAVLRREGESLLESYPTLR
ncbi:MAG: acetylxylan esterase [Bryobacterales bacterium]|nr:acetylxylan esterase [Bryobacterales bacterium]